MTINELERLITMLEPQADLEVVSFVKAELCRSLHNVNNDYVSHKRVDEEAPITTEDEKQRVAKQPSVEPFDEWLPNDPRNW
jgi:hypothetical protein